MWAVRGYEWIVLFLIDDEFILKIYLLILVKTIRQIDFIIFYPYDMPFVNKFKLIIIDHLYLWGISAFY